MKKSEISSLAKTLHNVDLLFDQKTDDRSKRVREDLKWEVKRQCIILLDEYNKRSNQ